MSPINEPEAPLHKPAPKLTAARFAIFSSIAQGSTLVLSIVRSKVLAAWIGPDGMGIFAQVNQVVSLATTAGAIASGPALLKWLAESARAKDSSRFARTLGSALLLGVAINILAGVVSVVIARWVLPTTWTLNVPLAIMLCAVGATLLGAYSVLLTGHVATGNVRALTLTSIGSSAMGVALTTMFVLGYGLRGLFVSVAVAGVASVTLAAAFPFVVGGLKALRPRVAFEKKFFRDAAVLGGATTAAAFLWQFLFSTIRGTLDVAGGTAEGATFNGNFQAAFAASYAYMGVIGPSFNGFFYPRFAAAASNDELSHEVAHAARFVLKIMLPIAATGIALRDVLVHTLYSHKFDMAIEIVGFYLAGDVAKAFAWIGPGLLTMRGQARASLVCESAGVAIGLVANVTLIRLFGVRGAGLGHLATYLVFAPVSVAITRAALGPVLMWRDAFRACACSLAMAGFMIASGRVPLLRWIALPAIALYVYKTGLMAEAIGRVRRKWQSLGRKTES